MVRGPIKTVDWLAILQEAMDAMKLSRRTKVRYLHIVNCFYSVTKAENQESSLEEVVRQYIAQLEREGASAATMNQAISAIKFFYLRVMDRPLDIDFRPRADKKLPEILPLQGIERIIAAAENPMHKLAIALAYSAGLRPSEIAAIKIADIDISRMTIFIRAGKGRKDRYTILAARTLNLLKLYLAQTKSQKWLFPGHPNGHITVRALQSAMTNASRNAGYSEGANMRKLRHSFATHLVENDTSLLSIRDLLGHSSLATTQIYLQVARTDALACLSPYDLKKPQK